MKIYFNLIYILVATILCSSASAKQSILCKKSESFDEAISQLNGLMIEPTWPIQIEYTKDDKSKTTVSANPKNFQFDTANIRYFETKEEIQEGKKKRTATIYNACIPIQYN